ncbi:PEP-CTERM protein-sorting domain-containing protein [Nitrosospira sp. Nsp11]|uniref:CHRD domain-containing protein n=1 Tax=Nitrosospira sp. Nsp11 TaxID=1855338 RepID=UPI000924011E|nr:CHRD domain-containing protein [Nitrosospira sp. Nsp11]SHL40343.1 PEP-CTERM protein-sorting domain-containing protein [Nitrosospira sp. Nsp11]
MKLNALFVGGLLAAAVAVPAAADQTFYQTKLDGPSEAPPNISPGTGMATVSIDSDLRTMHIHESFSGLMADTTVSHIHCCTTAPNNGTAGVATAIPTFPDFPSGVREGVYDHTFDMKNASNYNPAFIAANGNNVDGAFNALLTGLNTGSAYSNIHSVMFPMGEIRGFLAPIPEPETYAMLLAGLAMISAVARRRRA